MSIFAQLARSQQVVSGGDNVEVSSEHGPNLHAFGLSAAIGFDYLYNDSRSEAIAAASRA